MLDVVHHLVVQRHRLPDGLVLRDGFNGQLDPVSRTGLPNLTGKMISDGVLQVRVGPCRSKDFE